MTGESRPSSECPSCGRFAGPYDACPYCGAVIGRRMPVRLFKYGSLALAVAGVVILILVAAHGQAPAVEIGSLGGTMNWAHVRLKGTVSRRPTYDPEAGTLRFWVQDGSGEILALAYRESAQALLARGLVPAMGDGVTLAGTLRVRDEFEYLVLESPEHIVVRAPEPKTLAIEGIDAGLVLQRVTVQGVIRDDRVPYEGLRVLTVRDATGAIDLLLPQGPDALSGELPDLRLGQSVRASGAVDLYRGVPQVSIGRGSDLEVLDEPLPVAPGLRTGDINSDDVGRMAQVEGPIVGVDPFSAGVKLALDDGSGAITLLLWQDLYDSLPERQSLAEGAVVRVQGLVTEYRGELEIVPELPMDVALVEAGPGPLLQRRLSDLSTADAGRVVVVEGVLQTLHGFSAGVKGTLDDGTGTVTLLLWQDVYDALPAPASLLPGAVLRVEGEVAEYQGDLEIVPLSPDGVGVLGALDLPREERAIGSLTGDDVGRMVWISGQIDGGTPFAEGVRFALDDGTGTIVLLLWQNVHDRLQEPDSLQAGARVLVRGEIVEFRGQLEIVPQVPFDLSLIAGGQGEVAGAVPGEGALAVASPAPDVASPAPVAASPTPTAASGPTSTPTLPPTPTPTPAPAHRDLGEIDAADVGTVVTVTQAVIEDVSYFSKGIQYTLSDGSGRIVLLVWQDLLETLPHRYDLQASAKVRVIGEIDLYQGTLEIVPRSAADLVVLAPGARPGAEPRQTGALSAADEGRIVIVEGTVARVEGAPDGGWLKLWLDDGSGQLLVFVPARVADFLPAGVGSGVGLRVTGEVDVYQGQVEVIPLAGADVEVR